MTKVELPDDCFLKPIRVATKAEEEKSTWSRKTPGAFWVWKCKAHGPGCKREVVLPRVAVTRGQKSCGCLVGTTAAARSKALAANGQLFKKRQPAIVLGEQGARPIINGKEKRSLTPAQYDIIKALLDAGEIGLTIEQLDRRSGHGDSRKTMVRLVDSDPDWRAVIQFPGKQGTRKGYRIGGLSQSLS